MNAAMSITALITCIAFVIACGMALAFFFGTVFGKHVGLMQREKEVIDLNNKICTLEHALEGYKEITNEDVGEAMARKFEGAMRKKGEPIKLHP